jgi:periplasmic copper chaperone A
MMKALAVLSFCLMSASAVGKTTPAQDNIMVVTDAWIRKMPPASTLSSGYFKLTNRSSKNDQLLEVTSPVAEKVELHETVLKDGMAKMEALSVLNIPAGDTVTFEPRGKHLMLLGLSPKFSELEQTHLTLIFRHAGPIVISVDIK